MAEGEYTTERGFEGYAKLVDTYGTTVRVQRSSSFEDRVWIFTEGGDVLPNKGAAHLDFEQAKAIRDGLNEWIQWVEDNPVLSEEEYEAWLAEQEAEREKGEQEKVASPPPDTTLFVF